MLEADFLGTLATLYGVGAACTALLQARQVLRRRSSCEVSARFFATYAGGYAVWLLYGLSIGSLPLILVDAAGLLCGLVTLGVTLSMRGSLLRPATWARCPERPPHTIDARTAIQHPRLADAPPVVGRRRAKRPGFRFRVVASASLAESRRSRRTNSRPAPAARSDDCSSLDQA